MLVDGPWAEHAVAVHPPVVWALLGDTSTDPDLSLDLSEVTSDEADGHPLLTVSGHDRMRNRQVAAHHCAGTRFIASPAPDSEAGWTALVREATITGRGVIVEVDDTLPVVGRRWIERADHIPWAISSRTDLPIAELPARPWVDVAVAAAEATDDEWASALGPDVERTHRLTLDQLAKVSRAYPAVGGDVDAAVRRLVSGRLEHLARRIRPTRDWDDIVLSDDRMELLQSIVDALPIRGSGLRRVGVLGDAVARAGRAVLRPVGHRQDDGRRDHRRRARPRPVQARPVGGREQVHRRDREEPRAGLRRRRAPATWCCSSTRPTRCSASAPR